MVDGGSWGEMRFEARRTQLGAIYLEYVTLAWCVLITLLY
jgi:hypothetical protein